jgi:hypothetical protein
MSGGLSFNLSCFKQGNEVKYLDNPNCNTCFCWTGLGLSAKNPAPIDVFQENDYIRVKSEIAIFPCQLKLFNPVGQLLFERTINTGMEQIVVNDRLNGVYLYQLQKENEIVKAGKIMIK